MSVNRPTNVKVKEQDVNQKLQLYGIYEAFSNGKVPSNKQIDVALNSALKSRALASPSGRLSAEGKKLVADLRDVIEQAKILLLTKNQGEVLQEFVWRAQHINGGAANGATINSPTDKATAQQHGNQALDGLRTLGTLILSNGQFRKLLSDATILLRDMAGDAAQTAANRVNPDQERLNQIDQPAEDNTWHDVPDLSKGNLKSQAQQTYNQNIGVSKQDVKAAASESANAQQNTRDPNAAGNVGQSSLQQRSNLNDEDVNRLQETKNTAAQKTKNYLSDKMPQERREQTIWRLKKMLVEIQSHEDYQSAINTLLYLAETYTGHARDVAGQTTGTVQDAHGSDGDLKAVEMNLKTLIERFANYTSADDLTDAINNVYLDADRDPELKNWFKHLDRYIRACLKEQGYVLTDKANDEANQINDQGQFLLRERYRDHVDRVVDEFKFLGDQFNADPLNRSFGDSMQRLFNDLGNDENGKPTFKPHLLKDLTEVIIPAFFEGVRYVPLPRIEYSDPMIDAIVENLIIESDNLFPNQIELQSDNYFKWGRKTVASRNKNKFMFSASGVQMDLKDVSYYIHKKTGFPSIKDKGVMDIFMGGQGFSFKVAMETADVGDRVHFFKVQSVKVQINNLKLKMKQSNHKLLFNIFKPTLMGVVKPALTKVIEKQIKQNIEQGDAYLYQIKREADKAAAQAKNDPENAPNIYRRYVDAAQAKAAQGKKKTEAATADKKANVAMTQQDSMFQNIKLPGGISTKATEYKELAAKGDRWQSPIFGLGSAAETTGLPKAQTVQRKPHRTARGHLNPADGPTAYSEGGSHQGGSFARGEGAVGSGSGAGYSSGNTGAGYGQAGSGSGYSQGTSGAGYGQGSMGTGYDQQTAGVGHNQPVTGYGQGAPGASLTGAGAGMTGTNGRTGLPTATNGAGSGDFGNKVEAAFNPGTATSGQTTLGDHNPVLTGSV